MVAVRVAVEPGEPDGFLADLNRKIFRPQRRLQKRGLGVHHSGEVVQLLRREPLKWHLDGLAV